MTILAGGRTFAAALAAATLTYVMLALRGRRVRVGIGTALALLVALVVIQAVGQTGQYSRLTSIAGGIRLQDPNRYAAMTEQLAQFLQHPLLGKGLGVLPSGNYTAYVAQQLQYGGHSTYTSALANFGLVGGAFIAAVVLTPLVIAVSSLRSGSRRQYGSSVKAALAFVLTTGVVNSLVFLTGGNGFSDMSQYAILGLALACVVSEDPALEQDRAKGGVN
jgi:O-antigen ligase